MIKALFFDIDGTLVSFKTHQIPESTIQALTEAKKKGLKIFIATGRPPVIINNLQAIQEKNLIDGYITMNGGYCFVGNEVIYQSPIPQKEVKTLLAFCREHNYPCIIVYEKHLLVCQDQEIVHQIFYNDLNVDPIPAATIEDAFNGEAIFQMTPFFSSDEEQKILPLLTDCENGRWHPAFTDMTAKGNTKQKGIDAIIQHFGFKLRETMAFGDGGNDISMLKHAGIGVAMGNASDEVRKAANYITTPVDKDGIAKALKHFQLI